MPVVNITPMIAGILATLNMILGIVENPIPLLRIGRVKATLEEEEADLETSICRETWFHSGRPGLFVYALCGAER